MYIHKETFHIFFRPITLILYDEIQLSFRSPEIGRSMLFQISPLSEIIRRPPKYVFRASCVDLASTDVSILFHNYW